VQSGWLESNKSSIVVREPIGVVGVIVLWNWPILLMLRDVIPALAAGNAVVVKPASNTAAISMETLEVLLNTGAIPKGIINVVTGPGQSIGEVLAKSEKVGMISFTGDNFTGQRVAELASKSVKKVSLELGGKSPNVIFEDADLDKAIPSAINGTFSNCGQICMACTRLVVQDTVFDEVVGRMKLAAENLKVGNGLDEDCQMGPVVSQKQLESVIKYIEIGKKEGNLITGGCRLHGSSYDNGFFIAPTIFTGLSNDSPLV
jgi:betaine-aldehyde dehydrogenase